MNQLTVNNKALETLISQHHIQDVINVLASTPEDDLKTVYHQLASCLVNCSQQKTSLPSIHQEAEAMRSLLHFSVCQLISLFQLQGDSPSRENEAIARSCKIILNAELSAYSKVFNDAAHTEKKGLVAISTHRLMTIQLYIHMLNYIMHKSISAQSWIFIQKLFLTAEKFHLLEYTTADNECYIHKPTSIKELYISMALMASAGLQTLNTSSIIKTFHTIFERANLVKIDRQLHNAGNDIAIDDLHASSPHFLQTYSKNSLHKFQYFHLEEFLDRLKKQRTDNDPVFNKSGLTDTLKAHLINAWSKYQIREPRTSVNLPMEAVIGLNHIHYYLSGGKEFQGFLGDSANLSIVYEAHEHISLIEQRRGNDIWSPGFSEPTGKLQQYELPADFSMQTSADSTAAIENPQHPLMKGHIIDQSLHGCRLELSSSSHYSFTIGDLIALHQTQNHQTWQLGEIIWVKIIDDEKMHAGIRILGKTCIAVGIDIPLFHGAHKNYTRGILLPHDNALQQPHRIITEETFFQEGECLHIAQKGVLKELKLTKKCYASKHYHQFDCGLYSRDKIMTAPDQPDNSGIH